MRLIINLRFDTGTEFQRTANGEFHGFLLRNVWESKKCCDVQHWCGFLSTVLHILYFLEFDRDEPRLFPRRRDLDRDRDDERPRRGGVRRRL